MHGLIFTTLRQFTESQLPEHAAAIWEGQPRFLALDVYDDELFEALVERAVTVTGTSRQTVLRDFGRYTGETAFSVLRPEFYESSSGTREFLLNVEEQIHETLRSTIAGAAPPRLQVVALGEAGVSIAYTSERRLCHLVEGLVHGTAAHYGERFEITQPTCVERSDIACSFFVIPS